MEAKYHTFTTRNDLQSHVRENMISLLNQQLADTFDLFTQVKQAHWNVKGKDFIQFHLLSDDLAETLFAYVDSIAERATALGGIAMGTARMVVAQSRLPEFPPEIVHEMQVVEVLAQRYGAYASSSRAALSTADEYGDPVTADLFTEISRTVEKHLWLLDAHLQS